VAVIISDAMRYEVAVELKENLNKNTNGTIELTSMAGCLPSYTKLGMAALLPHTILEFQKEHILVDGMNADGIENREKILTRTKRSRLHSGSKSSVSSEEIKPGKKSGESG